MPKKKQVEEDKKVEEVQKEEKAPEIKACSPGIAALKAAQK